MNQCLSDKHMVQKGFSLLEVMVAMVIMSMSLTLLYNAVASSTNSTRVADEYLRAVMLAESVLAANRRLTEPNLSLSDAHDKYDWELRAWPVQESQHSVNQKLEENLSELNFLSVAVSWPSGDTRRRVDLLSIVPIQVGVE